MLLVGGGLLGTVEEGVVPDGFELPGRHGFATVEVVPIGEALDPGIVELVLAVVPVLVVLPADEGMLPGVVAVVVVEVGLPGVVLLLLGVQGVTVFVVPLCVPPVTEPALPATPGVPGVTEGLPVELAPGCDVGSVPTLPCCGVVDGMVPGGVTVPGEVPVCVPIPGLGVTVPVVCAAASPRDNANTDETKKILRIESCSLSTSVAGVHRHTKSLKKRLVTSGMPLPS
jgi:hypothetical protein